jgi:XTP/dITP diphosphohydrolase
MKLVVATRNRHKLEEIRSILGNLPVELHGVDEYPKLTEVVEDGNTLRANAIKKAVLTAIDTGEWALADDTGLEVDALNGAPGVRSARYAGEDGNAARNLEKLLRELKGRKDRGARFRCVIAMASPSGMAQYVEGVCDGAIAEAPRGDAGFGYDPVFQPDGSTETFAQMAPDRKNRISHRGVALENARITWEVLFRQAAPRDWPRR